SPSNLQSLFSIMELPSIQKVCFDGRMDHSALFHGHSTTMANVLDLQIVNVYSRVVRGEPDKQLARLSPCLLPGNIASNRAHYLKLHKLISLGNAMKEHGFRNARTDGAVDHTQWMCRPLLSDNLQYTADKVYNIGLLFDHFVQKGYITPPLLAPSMKYVRLWSDAQPTSMNVYRSHPIMPLKILE
ncbi:hypothetical protein B0H17DRAFT_894289, partial [Mycena rosella]